MPNPRAISRTSALVGKRGAVVIDFLPISLRASDGAIRTQLISQFN
jgi:hypothetical protein